MSNVNKMSMKDILNRVDVELNGVDQILYFYEGEDGYEKVNLLKEKMKRNTNKIFEFLLENSDEINIEKYILVTTRNYIENIKIIDKKIKDIEKKLSNKLVINEEEIFKLKKLLNDYINKNKQKEENLKKIRKLGSNLDIVFSVYYYDTVDNKYYIDLLDSEVLIKGKKRKTSKQIERFKKIDEQIKNNGNEDGIKYILQKLLLTDLDQIFEDPIFAHTVRRTIIDNQILAENLKTRDEIEQLRKNDCEYDLTAEQLDVNKIVTQMKEKVEEYIDYLNFDKFLLVAGCKIEDVLENGLDPKYLKGEEQLLKCILDNLKENNKEYNFNLQFYNERNDSYLTKEISYSKKNIEYCLKRFINNKYITKKEIQEKRSQVQEGSLNVSDLDNAMIDILYSKEELNKMNNLSDKDFLFFSERFGWDKQNILEKIENNKRELSSKTLDYLINSQKMDYKDLINLFLNQKVDIERFKEVCKKVDISNLINVEDLLNHYMEDFDDNIENQKKEKYNRYVTLCKEYILKDEEKSKIFSEELMEKLIDNFDINNKEDYITQIKEFFQQGFISLDSIIEFNGEDEEIIKKVINDMYIQGVVDFETVKELIQSNILTYEYLEELVDREEITSDKILQILNDGFINEDKIFDLFVKKRISNDELINLANKDIIDSRKVNKVLGINRDEIETEEQYVLLISGALQKIKTQKSGGNSHGASPKDKKVINPDRRLELFDLLGARKFEAVLPKNSPFYNYDFFVIPDKNGDYKKGIVIAERIYEEKPEHLSENEEIKYATDNATYIFENIEDIKIIQKSEKQNKTEAIKRKNGIIKRVNHILADGRNNGRWAFDLRDAITKIMIGSDLKEYSKANQSTIINQKLREVYGIDNWMRITNKAAQIDFGNDFRNIDDDGR